MKKNVITREIIRKQSMLCVGLDTEISKLPKHILKSEDPIFEFNKHIIDATSQYAVAYKPNIAFYESHGITGWKSLEKTIQYIKQYAPEVLIIADAKRGDIGNTAKMYAQAFFEQLPCDAVTVAPYMGRDSVTPFLEYDNKWAIILALTSNAGAQDFQLIADAAGTPLFKHVLETSKIWGTDENTMYVVGATQASMLKEIRKIVPHHFLLVPGVGAQGGSLHDVVQNGINSDGGLLINSSRGILYADSSENFAATAAEEAAKLQQEMAKLMSKYL